MFRHGGAGEYLKLFDGTKGHQHVDIPKEFLAVKVQPRRSSIELATVVLVGTRDGLHAQYTHLVLNVLFLGTGQNNIFLRVFGRIGGFFIGLYRNYVAPLMQRLFSRA